MILLTGATGLLGQFLLKEFLECKEKVRILVRPQSISKVPDNIKNRIEIAVGDILDVPSLETAMQGVTKVVHAAAIVSFDPSNRDSMLEVNVSGTKNLVNVCLNRGTKKFIHISSIAALGRANQKNEINEKSKWEESKWNSPYAITKYNAELEVWRGFEEGLSGFIINPSVIFGPGSWAESSTAIFKKIYDTPRVCPEGGFNCVDVRDVVKSVIKLDDLGINHERFIVNSGVISIPTLYKISSKQFGRKGPRLILSKKMLYAYFVFFRFLQVFTGKRPKISKSFIRTITRPYKYSSEKLKAMTGIDFISPEESILWTSTKIVNKIMRATRNKL